MQQVATLGIDAAKNLFQLHGVDARGKIVLKKRLVRHKVLAFVAGLAPCLIGLEASGSAHYWARELTKLGHTVQLVAYLGLADNFRGPLLSRLRGLSPPVVRSRNRLPAPYAALLSCFRPTDPAC